MARLYNQNRNYTLDCKHKVSCYEQITSLESHCHILYEIIYVLDGEVSAVIEEKSYHIPKGSLLLLTPASYHSITVTANMNYDRVYILFDTPCLSVVLENEFASQFQSPQVFYLPEEAIFFKNIKKICEDSQLEKYRSFLRYFLNCTCFDLLTSKKENETIAKPEIDPLVAQLITYIEENITRDIRISTLSKHLGTSVSSICHKFKSYTKTTIMQYIIQKKIAHSIQLMKEGKSATEASILTGYGNYTNFYNEFKKVTGKTPSTFNLQF